MTATHGALRPRASAGHASGGRKRHGLSERTNVNFLEWVIQEVRRVWSRSDLGPYGSVFQMSVSGVQSRAVPHMGCVVPSRTGPYQPGCPTVAVRRRSYLSLLCLPRVARYCARGGVKVVSAVCEFREAVSFALDTREGTGFSQPVDFALGCRHYLHYSGSVPSSPWSRRVSNP